LLYCTEWPICLSDRQPSLVPLDTNRSTPEWIDSCHLAAGYARRALRAAVAAAAYTP